MPVFESSAEDVLGLWTSVPAATAGGQVSFGIGETPSQLEGEVYRSNLPGDLLQARQVFNDSDAALERVRAALEGVPDRLDGLVSRTQQRRQAQAGSGVSFAAGGTDLEPGAEGELLSMLAEADQSGQTAVSFGIGEIASDAWNAAKAQFDTLIQQLDRDVLHFAWVETSQDDRLLARTTVAWGGDMQNLYEVDIDSDESNLHEHTIVTVTLTRHLRLRLFATVVAGSFKAASLMIAPGGAVLALPAIFNYVTKIVAQARELQSIQNLQGA